MLKQFSIILPLIVCGCVSSQPRLIESAAPRVDCEQAPGPDLPDWPDNWALDGPSFAITILGALTDERLARSHEHACLRRLKQAGQIR